MSTRKLSNWALPTLSNKIKKVAFASKLEDTKIIKAGMPQESKILSQLLSIQGQSSHGLAVRVTAAILFLKHLLPQNIQSCSSSRDRPKNDQSKLAHIVLSAGYGACLDTDLTCGSPSFKYFLLINSTAGLSCTTLSTISGSSALNIL